MAYAIDTVIRGAGPDAHLQLLDVLRALYRLGLRVVQLPAHNWSSEFADWKKKPYQTI